MSSSDRVTCSKGKSEGFSIPYEMSRGKGKGKKATNQQDQPDMAQQSTSATDGVQKLQQQAVIQFSSLSPHHTRPTSSQSITGPLSGERLPPRALSVVGTAEGQPQSTPPLLNLRHPQQTQHTLCHHHQPEQAHHRYHFKQCHKILVHIYLKCLFLYLQKTDAALALMMTRRFVM